LPDSLAASNKNLLPLTQTEQFFLPNHTCSFFHFEGPANLHHFHLLINPFGAFFEFRLKRFKSLWIFTYYLSFSLFNLFGSWILFLGA